MTDSQKELFEAALQAQKQSHAPYSKAYIGAAIRMHDGRIFSGCNIENASYGATVCAERVAIWKAVSTAGVSREISEVMVISDAQEPWPPCGLCRQVMAEFARSQTQIFAANLQGKLKSFTFSEIFPESFTPDYLAKI